MIKEFVDRFEEKKNNLKQIFKEKHPEDYADLVKSVISILANDETYGGLDPEKIHCIDDGDYQGTLLFIIPEKTYQPDVYWAVKVGYGSCSGCDTLESIRGWLDNSPTEDQVNDYMTLALHVVQGIKLIED